MIFLTLLVTLFLVSASAAFNETDASTVDTLNLDSYAGHWFQMYDNKKAEIFTPKNSICVTADYAILEAAKLSVHNYGIKKNGDVSTIDGYAYGTDAEEPGQLKLHLDGVPVDGEYWVYALGPVNKDDLYDWALVSTSKLDVLYILARNVDVFRSSYQDEVLQIATDLGFTGYLTKPVETYQEKDCVYGS